MVASCVEEHEVNEFIYPGFYARTLNYNGLRDARAQVACASGVRLAPTIVCWHEELHARSTSVVWPLMRQGLS